MAEDKEKKVDTEEEKRSSKTTTTTEGEVGEKEEKPVKTKAEEVAKKEEGEDTNPKRKVRRKKEDAGEEDLEEKEVKAEKPKRKVRKKKVEGEEDKEREKEVEAEKPKAKKETRKVEKKREKVEKPKEEAEGEEAEGEEEAEEEIEIIEEKEGYRVKIKPELSDELKHELEIRSIIKKKTPDFKRQEWFRYKRLGEAWRRPRGLHSKMRKHKSYRVNVVSIGYGSPKGARNLHPSGFEEVMVHNTKDLDKIDPKSQAARVGHTVGTRKRIKIEDAAEEKGIRVLNPRGL
ncbi:MAG: 50S ribosomal protein L32e [Thermoplasmata archaeon]